MRRTKLLLWLPFLLGAVINFFALVIAGFLSNTATGLVTIVWWLWLFLVLVSVVLLSCWVAYWRRLPD
ncbi:hypothetical protein AGRA3207_003604 [Actinomadura graeca]|uniref:DUF4175 domain-containing protein n=1 Tax=Actinomadura graeca TaxID=2750812 RepID=A0ABX8QUS6_9ACTN|nr:hypothetical protein [Actinomadura graeca]QXJ22581.1 hypothetical protein AGRA3207_003604 [Actinomadura graeca]